MVYTDHVIILILTPILLYLVYLGVLLSGRLLEAFTIEVFMSLKQRWNQLKRLEGKHGDAAADLGLDMQSFTQAPFKCSLFLFKECFEAFEERGEVLHYRVSGHPWLGMETGKGLERGHKRQR